MAAGNISSEKIDLLVYGPIRPILENGFSDQYVLHKAESRADLERLTPDVLAKTRGMAVTGPFPADTLFTPAMLADADAVLAMYHDQGLPVLKHASFGRGVNVTLGLPVIRTSVDHGTALDRAGQGEVDAGSLREAVALALELASRA